MIISEIIQSVAIDIDREWLKRLPCAEDVFATLLRLIPYEEDQEISVAILGSGDGFTAALILAQYSKARITLIDADEEHLNKSRARFADSAGRVPWLHADFARNDPPEKYDLIISVLAIHNLNGIEKRALFRTLYSRVLPNSPFLIVDHVQAPTEHLQDHYRNIWAGECRKAGLDDDTIKKARARMADDHCSEVEEQLEWLRNAGFRNVDTYYKNLMFAVYGGNRPDF